MLLELKTLKVFSAPLVVAGIIAVFAVGWSGAQTAIQTTAAAKATASINDMEQQCRKILSKLEAGASSSVDAGLMEFGDVQVCWGSMVLAALPTDSHRSGEFKFSKPFGDVPIVTYSVNAQKGSDVGQAAVWGVYSHHADKDHGDVNAYIVLNRSGAEVAKLNDVVTLAWIAVGKRAPATPEASRADSSHR